MRPISAVVVHQIDGSSRLLPVCRAALGGRVRRRPEEGVSFAFTGSRCKFSDGSRAPISLDDNSRYRPLRSHGGRATGPKPIRIKRLTVNPRASNMRRTSRFRPSRKPTRYQWLAPFPPASSRASKHATPSSSSIPDRSLVFWDSETCPRTRTAYSLLIPNLGCISRFASSPELVNSSRPLVLKSSRPTAIHLPELNRGRAA